MGDKSFFINCPDSGLRIYFEKEALELQQYKLNKQQLRHSFNKAAAVYDDNAVIQQEVCKRLLERLEYINTEPGLILDIGAGTGQGSIGLAAQYPDADVISLDLAENMLLYMRHKIQPQGLVKQLSNWLGRSNTTRLRHQFVCADAEQLPFSDASVDLVFSNLTIQWCQNLSGLFQEFRRILKPGGLLLFTTFGPDTLKELRASWSQVSDKVHVNQFADMHDIGDALYHVQVENPVMDSERIIVNYQSVKDILLDLKAVGAHNQNNGRERALTGKNRLKSMYQAYEQFRNEAGYPLTYEVLYGHAWNPATPMQHSDKDQTSISLAQLKSSLRS